MSKKEFEIIEEDGVVICDESDDYASDEIDGGFRLKSNEEIFTDEYMLDFANRMDAKIAREKKLDRIISVSVIVGIVLLLGLSWLLLASCQHSAKADYETQWFTYTDSVGGPVKQLCEVKYYVNGDTLFTSEKYRFLTLAYSFDDDGTLMYQHIVFFDTDQQPDAEGWYHIVFDRDEIPREPGTHLSGIVLRNCLTPLRPDSVGDDHANAFLFNSTIEMPSGRDRNTLSPQLSKLLPAIK